MIVFNQHIDRQLNNETQYKAFLESYIYRPMIYTAFFFQVYFGPYTPPSFFLTNA